MFDNLHACDIPLLIFSAGVGDIIREVIAQNSHMYPNMHVVSNDLDFDNNVSLPEDTNILHDCMWLLY